MSSFIGDYTCKADSKCRVVVPASFRRVLASSQQTFFVLRKNVFENCIDMYPREEWERMIAGLKVKLNSFNARHVAFLREFCRGTQEVEMDANGRTSHNFELVNRKVIVPTEEEVERNPRARSAKLRIAEKIKN